MKARIGIVVVSDRASAGVYEDKGGPAIRDCLAEIISSPYEIVFKMIPDERPVIEETLRELADHQGCSLTVTTGGTGPALRDVTPEATEAVCEKMMPGFGEQMRAERRVAAGDVVEDLAHGRARGLHLARAADLRAQRRGDADDRHACAPAVLPCPAPDGLPEQNWT